MKKLLASLTFFVMAVSLNASDIHCRTLIEANIKKANSNDYAKLKWVSKYKQSEVKFIAIDSEYIIYCDDIKKDTWDKVRADYASLQSAISDINPAAFEGIVCVAPSYDKLGNEQPGYAKMYLSSKDEIIVNVNIKDYGKDY